MDIKKLRKGAILFAVLLLPSLVYVILSSGEHAFNALPIAGPKEVKENGDTLFYRVPDISLSRCEGINAQLSDYEGHITVVSFYNPQDSLVGTRVGGQILSLDDRFRDNSDVFFVSIGIITDSSSLHSVCNQALEYTKTSGNKWNWYYLQKKNWEKFAHANLLMDSNDTLQKPYYSWVVLLDKKQRIRSYRDGTQYTQIKALVDDIKVVKAEDFISYKRNDHEGK